jgi:hypothetical protein
VTDPSNGNAGKGFKARATDWLFLQGVSTILLGLLLVALGWAGKYAIETGIPMHLQMIQSGYAANAAVYEKSIDKLLESRKEERAADAEDRKAILEVLKSLKDGSDGKHAATE